MTDDLRDRIVIRELAQAHGITLTDEQVERLERYGVTIQDFASNLVLYEVLVKQVYQIKEVLNDGE